MMVAREVGTLQKWYAVRRGRNVGIYPTWEQACEQIRGLDWAEMKTFDRTSMVDGAVDRGLLSAKIWLRSGQNEENVKHLPQPEPFPKETTSFPANRLDEQASLEPDEFVVNASCFALKANVSPMLANAFNFGLFHAARTYPVNSSNNRFAHMARKLDEKRRTYSDDSLRLKSIESLKKLEGIKLNGRKRRIDSQENILPSSDSDDSMRTTMAPSPIDLPSKSRKQSDIINFSRKARYNFLIERMALEPGMSIIRTIHSIVCDKVGWGAAKKGPVRTRVNEKQESNGKENSRADLKYKTA
eukprot:760290-Hanusia_phi.AAC.7